MAIDFYIDECGDIVKDKICDNVNRYKYQQVFCRLKSIKGDFYGTNIGCNLESYIGVITNSKMSSIISSITEDLLILGVIGKNDIYMEQTRDFLDRGIKVYLKDNYRNSVYKTIDAGFSDITL